MLQSEIKRSNPTQDSDIGHLEVEDTETRRGEVSLLGHVCTVANRSIPLFVGNSS